jgi:hypothetical protein
VANPVASLERVLNSAQELFCVTYVTNGGNATDAAIVAGYANPDVQGPRNLTKPHIGARIRQLVALDITSQLGQLVAIALEIAHNPMTPPRERLQAIFGLLDRGGLAVPKGSGGGPSVAVQVNVNATANDAQAAIKEIWTSREARNKALAMGGHGSPSDDNGAHIDAEPSETIVILPIQGDVS